MKNPKVLVKYFTCVYIQFHLFHHMRVSSRNGVRSTMVTCCSNSRPPVASRWSIIHESWMARWRASQSHPRVVVAVKVESKCYGLEPSDGSFTSRVGGLHPLIAMTPIFTTNFRIAEFQMKVSLIIFVVFQLIQNRKQVSIWVIWILIKGVFLTGEQTTSSIVTEYFLE